MRATHFNDLGGEIYSVTAIWFFFTKVSNYEKNKRIVYLY